VALFGRRERGASAPLPEPLAGLTAHGIVLPAPTEPLQMATDLTVWSMPVVDGEAGLDLWTRVRAVHPATGIWPVLVTANTVEATAVDFGEDPAPVAALDAEAWFADRGADSDEQFPRGEPAPFEPPDPAQWAFRVATMPDEPDRMWFVPSPGGWAVPGQLGWSGAVNADVMGDVHTAVLRRWAERWDADLVVLGFDTLTLRVMRPPASPASAFEVAHEMALYCEDLVHQGVQTLDALVPMAASPAWWFWWD
jgi:hypothetical protein